MPQDLTLIKLVDGSHSRYCFCAFSLYTKMLTCYFSISLAVFPQLTVLFELVTQLVATHINNYQVKVKYSDVHR